MIQILLGRPGTGKTRTIKKEVEKHLWNMKKVCVVCLDKDLSYFTDTAFYSKNILFDDLEKHMVDTGLTILAVPYLYRNDITEEDFNALFENNFDYVFIDESSYILKNIVNKYGKIYEFFNYTSETYPNTKIIISCQKLEQLVGV